MRKASAYHFYIKKSLHISVILMCAHASVNLPTLPLFIIVTLVFIILSWAIFKGFLSDPISKEKEWGVLYFVGVFAAMLLVIIFKNLQELPILILQNIFLKVEMKLLFLKLSIVFKTE